MPRRLRELQGKRLADWDQLIGFEFGITYEVPGRATASLSPCQLERVECNRDGRVSWLRIMECDAYNRRRWIRIHASWVKKLFDDQLELQRLLEGYVGETLTPEKTVLPPMVRVAKQRG